jgi:HK97 family phage major capsid protein
MSRAASIPLEFRTEYPVLTSDSSHTYGSYATPTTLARECVIALVSESAVLDAQPRILRTTTGETVDVPVVLSGGLPSATYRAEGAAADQDTPVFSKTTLHAYHLSGYIEVSQEFLTDALSGDAEAIIGRIIGAGLGSKLATELAVGDGSDHVDGVFNAPTQGVPAAASETYTADELLALRASVTSANRKGARWLFSDAAYSLALTMKASDGTYLIQPSPTANAFDTLWGQPVHVDAYGPALTTGLFPVLYGRFDQAYCVRFAGNLEISSSDDVKFTSWTRTYRYGVRVDAGWLDTAAVKAIELS